MKKVRFPVIIDSKETEPIQSDEEEWSFRICGRIYVEKNGRKTRQLVYNFLEDAVKDTNLGYVSSVHATPLQTIEKEGRK